jgi:hypothetical protein
MHISNIPVFSSKADKEKPVKIPFDNAIMQLASALMIADKADRSNHDVINGYYAQARQIVERHHRLGLKLNGKTIVDNNASSN